MSFVDNQKTVGTAFFIIGILMIIAALLQFYDAYAENEGDWGSIIGFIIAAIGSLLAAIIYFKFGNAVRKEAITGKLNILVTYVRVVGYTSILVGVFMIIGSIALIFGESDAWGLCAAGIVKVVLGIIIMWVAKKMDDGKQTTFDKILWIILVVVFAILFISSFIGIFDAFGSDGALHIIINVIAALCQAIIYLFMLCYMFDGEVKSAMNM